MVAPLLLSFLFLFLLPLLFFFFFFIFTKTPTSSSTPSIKLPRAFPLVGSFFAVFVNRHRRLEWLSDILQVSPNATFTLHRLFGQAQVFTANPAVVQHILKTQFHIYQKGDPFRSALSDFLGDGIFNADGESRKFQRQVSSHEFSTKSLRKFVETVVDAELSDRLVPVLNTAARACSVLDFQDVLQRFAFDNVCKIAFGYDPAYLSPSFGQSKFAKAFEDAVRISSLRFQSLVPIFWKLKKFLDIGTEKRLRIAVAEVRGYAKNIIEEKKNELQTNSSIASVDLLSRFLSSGHSDEDFVTDIIISFILAGQDTTSAALTWFFWLLPKYPQVEDRILDEICNKSEDFGYDEVKNLTYTHAALCESMRLYPPVPVDGKQAVADDVLPDGTVVRKGERVAYHPYAMGRMEGIWGKDWAEFRPERWLESGDDAAAKWRFVGRDNYTYPVFQAGPRICLGKEMAFMQMKRMVAGILKRFRVVPAAAEGVEPKFVQYMTAKMEGGFPVRIEARRAEG
ncbi:cytochrome P450 94A2-like [Cucurbita pepo subsp. pepo]|uniref:cytochrome P450 94A2-like n=1 Tax=Cucurbita pepo subsp. pepo TaxID=3664 RepID=UPI000C9D8879|nr:cytochrome P450 94A2-like [Cucurbita pepo subsp. pepo]